MSSSTSSAESSAMAAAEEEDDRMVTEEFEAAKALADLSQLAMWSGDSHGRTTNNRVKNESPSRISESVTRCFDLPQEILAEPSFMAELDRTDISLKAEKDLKAPSTSLIGSSWTTSFGCGKSRRNLTENEKEERRMRRILANRESARQTIRRRQAVCEELTRKAANLVSENASLKKEVETATSEYRVLEKTNKELKDQVSMVEIAEATEKESRSSPLLYNNHPSSFTPMFWPSLPSQYQNPADPPPGPPPPHFFPVPYPWFFHHGTPVVQSQPSILDQDSGPSSRAKTMTRSFLPVKETEAKITDDLNEEPSSSIVKMSDNPPTIKHRNVVGLDSPTQVETCCEALCKKSAETSEARKRRKELRKLKNLHGHHSRMDY